MNEKIIEILSQITAEEREILDGRGLDSTRYTTGRQFIIDADRMLEQGQLFTMRTHTRFIDFPPHRHNYVEIMYMCSGETHHTIDEDVEITLKTGELLLLNQHATHAIRRTEREDVAVNFLLLPQFFDYALELIGKDNPLGRVLVDGLKDEGSGFHYLHFRVGDLVPVQNLIENMVWTIVVGWPQSNQISQVTMGLLFLFLLEHTERMDTTQSGGTNGMVIAAMREIQENYPRANLSALAKRCGVSVPYFSSVIKQATGQTFKALLQEKRLSRAAELLTTTNLSVSEVISAVGYDNTSFFYRLFKQKYGKVPKEYRRDLAKKSVK